MRLYISAAKSRNKLPQYEIEVNLPDISDEDINNILVDLYSALAPYNRELNAMCKKIVIGLRKDVVNAWGSDCNNPCIVMFPKLRGLERINETTKYTGARALRVLKAKFLAEFAEYIEDNADKVESLLNKKEQLKGTCTRLQLFNKLFNKKFGRANIINQYCTTISDDSVERLGGVEAIRNFIEDLRSKYPGFEDAEFVRASFRSDAYCFRGITYGECNYRYKWDKEIKDYIAVEK